MLLSATPIVGTAWPASAPAKVTVSVPMPAVSVPAAVVALPLPIELSACRAVWMAVKRVALTATQVIAAVVKRWKERRNVPPVGVPPIVTVCTSGTAAIAAPALVYGPSVFSTTGSYVSPVTEQNALGLETARPNRLSANAAILFSMKYVLCSVDKATTTSARRITSA